jgi:pyruvate,water dikinase
MSQTVADAVREFGELSRADVDYAGGKGANLGELTAAGFPVPPGFVVGAPAYAAFCDGDGLRERIEQRLAQIDVEDTAELARASAGVRAEVETEPLLEWLADAVRGAYDRLAAGEDTESASFAGMNETFLNAARSTSAPTSSAACAAARTSSRRKRTR